MVQRASLQRRRPFGFVDYILEKELKCKNNYRHAVTLLLLEITRQRWKYVHKYNCA